LLSLAEGSPVFLTGGNVGVAAATRALRLDVPKAVHAGETFILRGDVATMLFGCVVTLDDPAGEWLVTPRGAFAVPGFQVEVRVPAEARLGLYRLRLRLSVGGSGVGVQLPLDVVPQLLRV